MGLFFFCNMNVVFRSLLQAYHDEMPTSPLDGTGVVNEQNIHAVFDVSLWLKAAFALGEVISGIAAFIVTKNALLYGVLFLTRPEFAEDPHDVIANYLLHSAQNLSIGTKTFAALYLISHGAIKLWLIIGLLRQKILYYPTSILIFSLFILYQLYRFSLTHSYLLLVISFLDAIVIALTWHEWKQLRKAKILN